MSDHTLSTIYYVCFTTIRLTIIMDLIWNSGILWCKIAFIFHFQERFNKAMALVGSEFRDKVDYYSTSWWPARELVEKAINKRHEVRLIYLPLIMLIW